LNDGLPINLNIVATLALCKQEENREHNQHDGTKEKISHVPLKVGWA
jgi:hypothetical protein